MHPRALFIPLFVFFLLFSACGDVETGLPKTLVLIGSWQDGFDGTLLVSATNILFSYPGSDGYGGAILENDNLGGYLVFRYDRPPSWNGALSNRYNALLWRNWQAGPPAVVEYAEVYVASATNSDGQFIAWPDVAGARAQKTVLMTYSWATNSVID